MQTKSQVPENLKFSSLENHDPFPRIIVSCQMKTVKVTDVDPKVSDEVSTGHSSTVTLSTSMHYKYINYLRKKVTQKN